jgi:hypothetical protein
MFLTIYAVKLRLVFKEVQKQSIMKILKARWIRI